ncbi:MAG: choice-of-anchor D domain-containing protein [Proteobacteria bacterium]|nr:choice-of-anchor D domain-containing protein [Pseudomonadota bacterium]
MQARALIPLLLFSVVSLQLQAATLFSDDFEDHNYNGWTVTGNVATSGTVSLGSYALRLKKTASAVTHINTVGYNSVIVAMNLAASGLENGDECFAEVSTDQGGSWQVLVQKGNGEDNKVFTEGSFSGSAASGNSDLQLRFRSTGNLLGDYCWGDNVSVTGTQGNAPEITVSGNGSFGSVAIDQSANKNISITNDGNSDLSLQINNTADPEFSISHQCPAILQPGNSCAIEINFTPTTVASFSGSIVIDSNDSDESSITINLSGSGFTSGGGGGTPAGFFDPLTGSGITNRSQLTSSALNGSALNRIDYAAYALPIEAAEPINQFQGRLIFNNAQVTTLDFDEQGTRLARVYVDEEKLPIFDFEFVQSGSHLIPVQRGLIVAPESVSWEWLLEPGRVWDEVDDAGFSRAAIPFALQESGANCTHNGVMTFLFKDDGSISNVAVQIGGETCTYFQYDLWGMVSAEYIPASVSGAAILASDYVNEVDRRMPVKPISELSVDYAVFGVDHTQFAIEQGDDLVTFGVAIDGTHYSGSCGTRYGDYPYCEVMDLPSYSTAKTAFASFALALVSQQNGSNIRDQIVTDYVPECNGGQWDDVTFENLTDMATGNYMLSGYESDEGGSAAKNDFFLVYTHAEKIDHSCNRYPRKATPGTKLIYHSSDTYILGNALDDYIGTQDIYEKVVNEIYKPLGLSPVTYKAVRTVDTNADMYHSHGMTLHKDDFIKLAEFLTKSHGQINGQQIIDANIVDDMLQVSGDVGLATFNQDNRYLNGVWTWDMGTNSTYNCPAGTWVSYMSGFGGIGVVMLPNDMVYYYVSDSNAYAFNGAAEELQKIRSFCP